MSIRSCTVIAALLATTAAAACDTPTVQNEEPVTATFSSSEGLEGVNGTIAGLERVLAYPAMGESVLVMNARERTSLQRVLADLRAARDYLEQRSTQGSGGPVMNGYGSPVVGGASWVTPTGGPGTLRNASYEAYTTCYDCSSMDAPKGQMSVQQFAGNVRTFSQESTFGSWQGYATGKIITTLTGPAQTGYISTHHWIDVWLGPDPHHYSQGSGQV